MDENIVKLNEKMKELLAIAKKKQNVLEQSEIVAVLSDVGADIALAELNKNFGIDGS